MGLRDVLLPGNLGVWRRDGEKWSAVWNFLRGVKFSMGDAGRLREELLGILHCREYQATVCKVLSSGAFETAERSR